MALTFQPKTEKELSEALLAPEGDYDFEILSAEPAVSAKGNAMIKVNVGLYKEDRVAWRIFDYLMPQMESKLRHFCDSTGLLSKYESGTLEAEDCKGRSGKCRVIIQADKAGTFPDRNAIRDYIVRKAKPVAAPAAKVVAPALEDDPPF